MLKYCKLEKKDGYMDANNTILKQLSNDLIQNLRKLSTVIEKNCK